MEFFCYHRDRPGSLAIREELVEERWSYMDRYAKELIARGPTFADDCETTTGGVHIVDLPDPAAARAFAFEEPDYAVGLAPPLDRDELVAYGPLLSDDGNTWLGTAVLLRAPDPDTARAVPTADRYADGEVGPRLGVRRASMSHEDAGSMTYPHHVDPGRRR
jgi:uncharacterized protein YciI